MSNLYLSAMNKLAKTTMMRVGHILLLFVIFHVCFLVFYALSSSAFFELGLWKLYFQQSMINSIGFIAFYASAFWLFPVFISKRTYGWLAVIGLVMIIGLGELQFKMENWSRLAMPNPSSKSESGFKSATKSENVLFSAARAQETRSPSPLPETFGVASRAMFNILLYMLIGTGYGYMLDWFRKDRQARIMEKERIQSELALLRYQLNPHFLFNTINDIYYLAIIKSDKTANALLELSHLLRYVLNEKEDWVPLDREIAHLQQFVQLHKFRFQDEITQLEMNLTESISAFQVAPLLLTTFAENAFKHGEPGTMENPLRISLEVKNGQLSYSVVNKVNQHQSKDMSNGIGLQNLQKRLRLLYPEQHQISFSQTEDTYIAQLQINLTYDPEYSRG